MFLGVATLVAGLVLSAPVARAQEEGRASAPDDSQAELQKYKQRNEALERRIEELEAARKAGAKSGAASEAPPAGAEAYPPFVSTAENFLDGWFERVSKIQAEQPHWVTPLVTVTPRLEQELRYDQSWESLPGGKTLANYDNGKGLEIIPADPFELIIGVPAWETENTSPRKQGWADEGFLLKYRLLSANEESGDYILTAFMGLSVPWGGENYTEDHYVFTPTVAFGKGWGDFDFQSTLGVAVPDNGDSQYGAGTPVLFNTTFQYRVMKIFWPEVEFNCTEWPSGKHEGINDQGDQVFITPGLVIGRIPISHRLALTIGAGYQIAVTPHPLYHNNFILSVRLPF
jgi:hypothetical protein